MVINKYKMVGSAFLAFGLLGNVAYGSGNENSDGVHADSSQRFRSEMKNEGHSSGNEDSDGVHADSSQRFRSEMKNEGHSSGNEDFNGVHADSSQRFRSEMKNEGHSSGNENSDGVHADSSQRSLWEDLRSALELAEDLDGYIEVARCMRKGIDFTLRSRNGETLLFFSSCPATVLMLVSHGELDLDAQDEEENTALHLFVRVFLECLLDTLGAGREEIEVLLGAGANPLVRNGDDETVLQIVRRWIDEEEALPMEARNSNSKAAIRKAKALAQRLERAEGEWRKAHRDDA